MALVSIILAAGKGVRMKSDLPKVMHEVMHKPMISYVTDVCTKICDKKPIVVVGYGKESIMDFFGESAVYAEQKVQLGTANAVLAALPHIGEDDDVLIVCADTPLIKLETLKKMKDLKKDAEAVILTSVVSNPFGYGRIIKDEEGKFLRITEEKDATSEERLISEVNSGVYIISAKALKNLYNVNSANKQGEYYLTDVFKTINSKTVCLKTDEKEILGVNDRKSLALAGKYLREEKNDKLMSEGVTIIDPENTYIEPEVKIGRDSIIYPGTHIMGKTVIGSHCTIRENTTVENSIIHDNVNIKSSTLINAEVEENSNIGPYAYLRPNAHIGKNVKIGDFVEVKNSYIQDNSKASHLAYIGDADIGKNVNIGCGVVFVNYDGKNKHRSKVSDNAFLGSNSNLVAPVNIAENAFIAAGSTVTVDVPENSLCVARNREYIKEDWNKK